MSRPVHCPTCALDGVAIPAPGHCPHVVDVIVIGSAGVWGKGPTLDDAIARARKEGPLGKAFVVAALPAAAGATVTELGALQWRGRIGPVYAVNDSGRLWRRRTSSLIAAVEAAITQQEQAMSDPWIKLDDKIVAGTITVDDVVDVSKACTPTRGLSYVGDRALDLEPGRAIDRAAAFDVIVRAARDMGHALSSLERVTGQGVASITHDGPMGRRP